MILSSLGDVILPKKSPKPKSVYKPYFWAQNLFIRLKKKVPSDLIIQLYGRNKSCQKCHFEQHWSSWSTFQDASFSPQESPKFSIFEKIKDLTNLTRIFQIWSKSVLIEIKIVRNDILNNLYWYDKFSIFHSSASRSLQSWPNS